MQVQIRGETWRVRFVSRPPEGNVGLCDRTRKTPAIKVWDGLGGVKRLDTIIHETLHAALWDLDEEAIEETATAIAEILWRLGYREEQE